MRRSECESAVVQRLIERVVSVIDPVTRPPFPPGRTEPCFCGSGRRFKHCCAAAGREGRPPHGIGVLPEFLDAETCKALCEEAEACASDRLKVVDVERSTAEHTVRKLDDRRVTERVDPGSLQDRLDGWVRKALEQRISPAVGRSFAWFEQPQLLKYRDGGFYQKHADSDNVFPEQGCWKKTLDRDISLLIYLNESFEGGALHFEHFEYTLRPRTGMLVWFPSDMRYVHAAQPVTSGLRFAVVSWAAFTDEPRVMAHPPEQARPL